MKDRLFYIAVAIMVIMLMALAVVGVKYQDAQEHRAAKAAYTQCLETNNVRKGLNTDKQILRDIIQDSIDSATKQLADPEVVKSYPPQVIEQAKANLIKIKKNQDRIHNVDYRDCDSIKP